MDTNFTNDWRRQTDRARGLVKFAPIRGLLLPLSTSQIDSPTTEALRPEELFNRTSPFSLEQREHYKGILSVLGGYPNLSTKLKDANKKILAALVSSCLDDQNDFAIPSHHTIKGIKITKNSLFLVPSGLGSVVLMAG